MKKQSQEDFIDIKELLNKFMAKWYYFAVAFFIFILIAVFIIKTSPKVYRVTSILQMKTGSTKTEKILDPVELKDNLVNIEDEILVIKSTNYIRETLDRLDFSISYFTGENFLKSEVQKNSFPFSVKLDSSANQITGVPIYIKMISQDEFELEVKGEEIYQYNYYTGVTNGPIPKINFRKRYKFDQPVKENLFGFTVTVTGTPEMYGGEKLSFVINNPEALTKQYAKKLEVELAGRESNILLLSTAGSLVAKERTFLDTLMYVVQQKDLDKKNLEGIKTIEFIDYQLANVSETLNAAEQDLESFQYSTSSIGEASALYERRDQLEAELADLNIKLSYFRNILNNLESLESVSRISAPASVGVDDPILSNLLIKLSDLNQQRIRMGRTATDANPVIQRLELDIKATKDALRDNLAGAINTTNIKVNGINGRIAQTNQMINRLPSASIRKIGLQRRFDFSDNTYELFQERKAAAAISLATNDSNWTIVEHARPEDTPVSPKSKFLILLAVFLGIIIPAAILLIKDYFNDKIKSKSDIEKVTEIPVLGTVTKGSKYSKLATEYNPKSPLLESLRDIRVNLQYLATNRQNMVIGFTSSTSGEGKTFCSVNLGVVIAQSGKRVLILDADLRNSNMPKYFKLHDAHGVSSYLIGNSTMENIIKKTPVKNLDLIQSGPNPPNPLDLLSLSKFENLINELKGIYDYIIIDAPPVGLVADYLLLSKFTEVNIYVSRYNFTRKTYFEKINELYENKKITNLSLILNDVKPTSMYGSLGKAYYQGSYDDSKFVPKKKKSVTT